MNSELDIQGHRGCRGLYPENTIPGFLHALDLGVNTLEMDVIISKDHKVVVSHEPFLNHEICSDLNGVRITKEKERTFNMYEMELETILKYDCGMMSHPRFPEQKKMKVSKAPFRKMVETVEAYAAENNRPLPLYNIEIKRVKAMDEVFHPEYRTFTDLVIKAIDESGILDRSTVQCFDIEVLQYMKESYPHVKQVFLVDNIWGIKKNIKKLGHLPDIYSPNYILIRKSTVAYCRENNMKIIPWTVNETNHLKKMMKYGVDGIITDYPDRLISLVKNSL